MQARARGGGWASETSDRQFKAMEQFYSRAAADLKESLKRQEQNIVSYCTLLRMVKNTDDDEFARRVLAKALELSPASYQVRAAYLVGITPRWGGSYEKMAAFVDEAKGHVKANAKLAVLPGFIYLDAGSMQRTSKNYEKAEELLTKALSYGGLGTFYQERAHIRQALERYDKALEDINRGIEIWPHEGFYFYRRSVILANLKRMDEALRDIETADLLSPNDEDIARHRKWLANAYEVAGYRQQQLKNAPGAVGDYSAAIRASPDNARSYLRRAKVFAEEKKFDEALADLERARQLDPSEFDICLMIDWILFKRQDWAGIISSWDRFIALNPDHSRAYVERGGAYYHKGDVNSALRDAKKAADLGSAEGRQLYERFKSSAGR